MTSSVSRFEVWKTLHLGSGPQTGQEFLRALKQAGCRVGRNAESMVGQDDFTVATKKSNVDLVIVTTVELDSKNRVTFEKICRFAMEHGLKLCSPEVGPLLRLQYQDEPLGEWFMIAMEQITNLGRPPSVFRVGRNGGGLWLRSWCGHPDYFRRANNPWIFVKPRK